MRWNSGSTIYNDCQLLMREMIQKKVRILGMLSAMLCCGAVSAQQHEVEMIPFGNMDQWIDRQIKESGITRRCHEECVCQSGLLLLSLKARRTRIWEVRRGRHPM